MSEQKSWASFPNEANRIRAVFGLPVDAPVPPVNIHTLLEYRRYLMGHLSFPFQALYAETKPPVRRLVHQIAVLGLVDAIGNLSEGILCKVEGIPPKRELPLADIGVREDDSNYPTIDDYAFWLLNWR